MIQNNRDYMALGKRIIINYTKCETFISVLNRARTSGLIGCIGMMLIDRSIRAYIDC